MRCWVRPELSACGSQGIDVRLGPDEPEANAILEANPSPTYLDVEVKTGHAITAALIDALERD